MSIISVVPKNNTSKTKAINKTKQLRDNYIYTHMITVALIQYYWFFLYVRSVNR